MITMAVALNAFGSNYFGCLFWKMQIEFGVFKHYMCFLVTSGTFFFHLSDENLEDTNTHTHTPRSNKERERINKKKKQKEN